MATGRGGHSEKWGGGYVCLGIGREDCLRAAVGLAVISAISDLKQEGQQGPEQQTHQATDTK